MLQRIQLGTYLLLLLQFNNDRDNARRHWPHAAIAISQYVFAIMERAHYAKDDPAPAEVVELLSQIAQFSSELATSLYRMQALANRLPDPTAPQPAQPS